jgi:DNA (cytosine-5)-methyltransferase 1
MRNGECWEQQTLVQTTNEIGFGLLPTPTCMDSVLDKMNGGATVYTDKTGKPRRKLLDGKSASMGLARLVQHWPTPTATDYMGAKQNGIELRNGRYVRTSLTTGVEFGAKLTDAVNLETKKKFPTPQASDHRSKPTSASWKAKGGVNFSLSNPEIQAKWPTPQASDNRDRGNMSNPSIQRRAEKGKQLNLSMVAHPTSGQLNPMWVEWLMGWPIGWTDLKPLEMDKSHCVQLPHGES